MLVVYTSNTGFTRRYAECLAQKLNVPCMDLASAHSRRGEEAVDCGWLCASKIKGLSKAKRRFRLTAVCAVGVAPAEERLAETLARGNRLAGTPVFYLRGGMKPKELAGPYKWMIACLKAVLKKPAASDENAAGMLKAVTEDSDFFDASFLDEVCGALQAAAGEHKA